MLGNKIQPTCQVPGMAVQPFLVPCQWTSTKFLRCSVAFAQWFMPRCCWFSLRCWRGLLFRRCFGGLRIVIQAQLAIRHGEYDINSTTSKASNFWNVPLTHSSTSLIFDDFGRCTLPPRIPTCPNEARRDFAVKSRVSGVFRGIAQSSRRE